MKSIFSRGVSKLKQEGVVAFVRAGVVYIKNRPRSVYTDTIRPRTKIRDTYAIECNGVTVHPQRTFDRYTPWSFTPPSPSEVEAGAVEAINNRVEKGDRVVVIGGGRGITAVHAARATGENGSVTVFEGSEVMVEQIHDTLNIMKSTAKFP
jgi:fibrillarin-like rRNA methylase